MKTKKRKLQAVKIKGLRRKWLCSTLTMVCVLGLVCVTVVTASFSIYHYRDMEEDLRNRVQMTADFFSGCPSGDSAACAASCIVYTQSFENSDGIVLQFISKQGVVIASSNQDAGNEKGSAPGTADITDAISAGVISSFIGDDSKTDARIVAASCPVLCDNGEIVGVMRCVMTIHTMDQKILLITGVSLGVLAMFTLVILLSNNHQIRSILIPLDEIIEKAQKIANGSYGIQIQSEFDDEIGDLARMINELSLKISENEKMQRDFISSLSHELRTPLTAITGWSETLLSSDKLDPDTRRGVRIIHREAGRLTEMVVDLLDFTRIQDDRMTLNMEMVDIRAEFEDTVFMYGSRLAEEGISLKYVDNDQEIPEISCDPQRLRQVFLNILNNAVKHGGEGKRIDAGIVYKDDYIIVKIRDYGPGIPEDELPLVKKKFYKGSSKARGTGIGLAVSDDIVTMHGGELTLENALAGGTLVTVKLPASQ